MAAGTNLVVPVVLWGKYPPTHCISCIYITKDQKSIVTGCYDGQICLWQVQPDTLKMTPRCLLLGHTAPVLCLSRASMVLDSNYIVSSSEAGEMSTWDLVDGKSCQVVKLPYVHTHIQAYPMTGCEDLRLFCCGYYPEVLIMDPFSLEILFCLSSRVSPDWISALHVLRPVKRKDDVVLGLTTAGIVKVWTLQGNETKAGEPYYENESKQIRCLNALSMICCAYNQRTVLIVCSKYWQIYDAGDFSLLCSVPSPHQERWMGGEFLATDRVLVWSDDGKGYMFKLPNHKIPGRRNSTVAESKEFHTIPLPSDTPFLFCVMKLNEDKPVSCPPAMSYHVVAHPTQQVVRFLLRGDSLGRIHIWTIPAISANQLAQLKQEQFENPPVMPPTTRFSLAEAWMEVKPNPVGIIDQLDRDDETATTLTSSIYLPQQSRLVIGRDDGSIVIIPATQTVMLQILHGNHQLYDDWPPHQQMIGHNGRVNCLLYPHHEDSRYDKAHLLSGGADFAICMWDLYSGNLLHRFCSHAGEITQLLVPPSNCSPRIRKCICSVATDHSVALLSLTERKCVVLASRHLFPVVTIKWRPLDDFLVVGCTDGSVYVWQMETGHLDRVLHGIGAEEVLFACDELTSDSQTTEMGLSNPAVHFFRGLRHRNLSAIRHATQRGLLQLQQLHHQHNHDGSDQHKSRAFPLLIQGLRTNPKDAESHILFFDIEALIVQLLSEEYSAMSPGTLEAHGLINQSEYQKVAALTQSTSPDAHRKLVDFLGKVKDKAENVERILKEKDKHGVLEKMKQGADNFQTKLQSKTDVGFRPSSDGKDVVNGAEAAKKARVSGMEMNMTMEIAQLLLSLLHAWGIDNDLDKVCEGKLGLLRPKIPVSFGVLSRGGYMSLHLPTFQLLNKDDLFNMPVPVKSSTSAKAASNTATTESEKRSMLGDLPPDLVELEKRTRLFSARTHWELSTTLTSNHLLAIISMANTLMSMNNATFIPEQEKSRKLHRQNTVSSWNFQSKNQRENSEDLFTAQQAQIKQGWSLLATLHCVLLPDKVEVRGSRNFKRPQVEMMARRWQHHCLEVREAAQALLLAELGRMGPKGRKKLVEDWAQYLPQYAVLDQHQPQAGNTHPHNTPTEEQHIEVEEEDEEEEVAEELRKPSSMAELKRKQTTAVVLLGVIGAEFGQDSSERADRRHEDRRKSSIAEGFNINNNLARQTSMALAHLLLAPPSNQLPAHTQLRRAAIDLIGRGFTVWEPYLEVTKILLGLLELCCDADKLVPSMTYGLPLTPQADSCRTARHALTLIATARPAAFITCMAREVARYNTMAQNAQALNVNLSSSILHKAKPEILRSVELLIDKMQKEISELLIEVMDIILHCVDPGHLKTRSLLEVFPSVCRFSQVTHCSTSRRIAVGSRNGQIALYELRYNKCQMIPAHTAAITALAFSPEGKFLASYSCIENRLSFWQTSTGMFGLGNSQTKCTKSYSTSPIGDLSRLNPLKVAKLIWINNRTVTLMSADGSETRFNV